MDWTLAGACEPFEDELEPLPDGSGELLPEPSSEGAESLPVLALVASWSAIASESASCSVDAS